MRDRMEKLVLLPFAVGCMSESSIAVAGQPPRRSKASNSDLPLTLRSDHQERTDQHDNQEEEEGSFSDESPKSSLSLLALPKPSISTGIHRLYKGVRSFSSLFMYKEEDMEEEEEMEIEIGLPTDVKHVTHIGWDGYVTADINPINLNALDSLIPPQHPPGDDDGHDTDRPFTSADVAPLMQLDGHSKFRPIA